MRSALRRPQLAWMLFSLASASASTRCAVGTEHGDAQPGDRARESAADVLREDMATPSDATEPDATEPDATAFDAAEPDGPELDASTLEASRDVVSDAAPDATPDAAPDGGTGCAPLRFPRITLRTVRPPAAIRAAYEDLADTGCFPLPECFLDTDNLVDDATGARVDVRVMVAEHFQLYEFVRTSLEMGYGPYVLVNPRLVETVESIRVMSGRALNLASGYRSPEHQVSVCRSICPGGATCCPSGSRPCACRSRHMWGDAVDLSITSAQYETYGMYAMRAGAPNCLLEAGSFHVDMSPCPVGCPYRF